MVHRDAEEAGGRCGLDAFVDLLEVTADGLLSVIDAEDRLESRRRSLLGTVLGHRIEESLPKVQLERRVEPSALVLTPMSDELALQLGDVVRRRASDGQ